MVGYGIYLKREKQKTEEWMQKLLKSRFFGTCFDHQEVRKNEVNLFCKDCHKCLCQHCLSSTSHFLSSTSHCLHKLIQIRRYVYQDVVRIQDMQKHLDCSKVQPYTLNASKVVFLNPRPQLKPSKLTNNGAYCKVCERMLSDQNEYCSIACKVSEIWDNSSENGNDFELFSFPIPEFSKICVDHQNVESEFNDKEDSSNRYLLSKSELLKPKKRLHKRKGIPHRAPFF